MTLSWWRIQTTGLHYWFEGPPCHQATVAAAEAMQKAVRGLLHMHKQSGKYEVATARDPNGLELATLEFLATKDLAIRHAKRIDRSLLSLIDRGRSKLDISQLAGPSKKAIVTRQASADVTSETRARTLVAFGSQWLGHELQRTQGQSKAGI